MRVCMLASEAFPYAKTGGLADVLAALPEALTGLDVEVTVMLPGYREALRMAGATERLGRVRAAGGEPPRARRRRARDRRACSHL